MNKEKASINDIAKNPNKYLTKADKCAYFLGMVKHNVKKLQEVEKIIKDKLIKHFEKNGAKELTFKFEQNNKKAGFVIRKVDDTIIQEFNPKTVSGIMKDEAIRYMKVDNRKLKRYLTEKVKRGELKQEDRDKFNKEIIVKKRKGFIAISELKE